MEEVKEGKTVGKAEPSHCLVAQTQAPHPSLFGARRLHLCIYFSKAADASAGVIGNSHNLTIMAARSRPRAGMAKEDPADAHEERNMWNQIVNDLKRLKVIHARATEVSNAIIDTEAKLDGSEYGPSCSRLLSTIDFSWLCYVAIQPFTAAVCQLF